MALSWIRDHKIILLTLSVFLIVIFWINPIREVPIDDDWAYTLTVKNFIETGRYVLHPWAAANFPFQVFLGSLFIRIFGYSFSVLRISTLFLASAGFISLYLFAQDLKIKKKVSGLLVLILLACPLFLKFSLSFMTDIPFLSLLVLSSFLYWRGFSRRSLFYVFLASMACGAAILTRQLGVALAGAVSLYGVIYFRRKLSIKMFLAGLVLPALAILWQLQAAFLSPNWGMTMIKEAQSIYFSNPGVLFVNFLIRPAYIMIYLSFFCFPLLPLLINRGKNKNDKINFLFVMTYILVSLLIGKWSSNLPLTFPYLPWAFGDIIPWNPLYLRVIITAGILAWAGVFWALVLSCKERILKVIKSGSSFVFLSLIFLSLLFYSLTYYKLGDEYLLAFVPFLLLMLGYLFKDIFIRKLIFYPILCISLVSLLISASLTRNNLSREEAYWKSCEELRTHGVPIKNISCDWTWVSYYSYQEYLDERKGIKNADVQDFFKRWLPEREKSASYVVTLSPESVRGNLTIFGINTYEIFPGSEGKIYVLKRNR